jgi:hypothetical protein
MVDEALRILVMVLNTDVDAQVRQGVVKKLGVLARP